MYLKLQITKDITQKIAIKHKNPQIYFVAGDDAVQPSQCPFCVWVFSTANKQVQRPSLPLPCWVHHCGIFFFLHLSCIFLLCIAVCQTKSGALLQQDGTELWVSLSITVKRTEEEVSPGRDPASEVLPRTSANGNAIIVLNDVSLNRNKSQALFLTLWILIPSVNRAKVLKSSLSEFYL